MYRPKNKNCHLTFLEDFYLSFHMLGQFSPFDFAFQLPLGPLAPLSKRYDKTTGYRPVTRPSIKILFNISLHILILPTRKPLKLIFLVLVFFSITSSDPACPRDRITVDSSWNRKVRKNNGYSQVPDRTLAPNKQHSSRHWKQNGAIKTYTF